MPLSLSCIGARTAGFIFYRLISTSSCIFGLNLIYCILQHRIRNKMKNLVCLFATILGLTSAKIEGEQKWEQEISKNIKIGLAKGGYSKAVLECSADWMAFVLSTDEDFKGVIYTKGFFHRKNTPCFLDASGGKDFALKLPYDDCGSKHDSHLGGYTTTVIVQHEKDLITPGDMGFTLLCKDEKTVNASIEGMRSRITLVDADPGAKALFDGGFLSAMSPTHIVTLTPPKISLDNEREEL